MSLSVDVVLTGLRGEMTFVTVLITGSVSSPTAVAGETPFRKRMLEQKALIAALAL